MLQVARGPALRLGRSLFPPVGALRSGRGAWSGRWPARACSALVPQPMAFSKVTDSRLTEQYLEDVFGEEDPLEHLRNIPFPNSPDPVVGRLSQADSAQAVFDLLARDVVWPDSLTVEQAAQALSTLFHLQKISSDFHHHKTPLAAEIGRTGPWFDHLVQLVGRRYPELDLRNCAYVFLCLLRLDLPLSHPVPFRLQVHLQRQYAAMDLTTLAYCCVALRGRNSLETRVREASLSWHLALAPALPTLMRFVERARTAEDLRQISICFNALSRLITDANMAIFQAKVSQLIAQGQFDRDDTLGGLVKIVSISLAKRDWHLRNIAFVRSVLLQLEGRVQLLSPVQTLVVSKVVNKAREPVKVFYEVDQWIWHYYRQCLAGPEDQPPSQMLELLRAITVARVDAIPMTELVTVLSEAIESPHFSLVMNFLFDIVRCSGLVHQKLCRDLLDQAFRVCQHSPQDMHRLRVRYYDFSSSIASKIRLTTFENAMIRVVLDEILTCPFPGYFCGQLSFLIAFDDSTLAEPIIERFSGILPNMNPFCLFLVARSLQVRFSQRQEPHGQALTLLETIQVGTTKRIMALLEDETDPSEIFMLYRALFCCKNSAKLFQGNILVNVNLEDLSVIRLNSITIPWLCRSLTGMHSVGGVYNPKAVMKRCEEYISNNGQWLHSVVTNSYIRFLYINESSVRPNVRLLELCSNHLLRDMNSTNGLIAVQCVLIFAHFNHLSPTMVETIFHMDFMDKLDQEIQFCGRTKGYNYPRLVRNQMLALNRAIILQYPQYKLPWFHEEYARDEYCDSELATRKNDSMRAEVCAIMSQLFGHENRGFLANIFSPYYNLMDFEVILDQGGQVVEPHLCEDHAFSLIRKSTISASEDAARGWTRFAVLLFHPESYAFDKDNLKGYDLRRVQELEIEGFHVVCINPFYWNGMGMGGDTLKQDYIRKQTTGSTL